MDYKKPAAQFLTTNIKQKGEAYIGKKITVKGTVVKVDTSNPQAAWIFLEADIKCNLGKFAVMANECTVGDTIYVDGFLKDLQAGQVLLEPAILRDPTAPFSPHQ